MTHWRLLGDAQLRYVHPIEDVGEDVARLQWGNVCFVIFSGTLYEAILSHFPEFQPNPQWPFARMPLATAPSGISIHFPLYGSPRAASAVEQLAQCGFSRLIGIGLCGGISPLLNIGNIVAPIAAIRGDAASLHYAPIEYPAAADFPLLSLCVRTLEDLGKIYTGIQYSTDALYRETHEQIAFWERMGAQSIDMECSTFFAVCHALHISACWIGVVSDLLLEGEHQGSIQGVNVVETVVAIFRRLITLQL